MAISPVFLNLPGTVGHPLFRVEGNQASIPQDGIIPA
jgi:hypothetical protein